jgi:hypothetical protein
MAKYTEGPWEVIVWETGIYVSGGPADDEIAEFYCRDTSTVDINKDEAIANAQLFLAAPKLLETLKDVDGRISALLSGNYSGTWDKAVIAIRADARAAIAATEREEAL